MTPREICAQINGRRLFGLLSGQGAATVVLEAGLGGSADDWSAIQPAVARFAHVLSYDRAGLGRSAAAPTPRTCRDIVGDLRGLLAAAELPPPYILVAHSWSGINARWFASHHPAEIAGMVLIDAVHEGKYAQFARVLSAERADRMWAAFNDPAQNDERIDRAASIAQLPGGRAPFDFPLIVLTRAASADPLQRIETELQAEFLKLSRRSRQYISAYADHCIQRAEPTLVIAAIREVVEATR